MTSHATIRPILFLLSLLALAAVATGPVLAKEGAEAQLDAPLSLATPSGTTIEVGWSVFIVEPSGRHPVEGSPVFIRLVPPGGGEPAEVLGRERPAGSGHYVASIVVPAGGIAKVIVGLRGEMCDASGCTRSDILFPLNDDALVRGAPATVPSVRTDAAVTDGVASFGPSLALIVGIALVIALAAGVIATLVNRRALSHSGPTAH